MPADEPIEEDSVGGGDFDESVHPPEPEPTPTPAAARIPPLQRTWYGWLVLVLLGFAARPRAAQECS